MLEEVLTAKNKIIWLSTT